MATTDTQTLVTKVSTRARDVSNIAHARATVLTIMSNAQRVVNSRLRSYLKTVDMTPTAGRVLYRTSEIAADAIRPVAIRTSTRDVLEIGWDRLAANDSRWLRTVGTAPQVFATIGRSMFAMVPAYVASPQAVRIVYIPSLADLVDLASDFPVIADEHVPLMLDLTETLLLMRARVLEPAQTALERFAQLLDLEGPIMDARDG